MDDIHAVDTNSIVMDNFLAGKGDFSHKRCKRRPRITVRNDYPCLDFEATCGTSLICIHEIREARLDGFIYCGLPLSQTKHAS